MFLKNSIHLTEQNLNKTSGKLMLLKNSIHVTEQNDNKTYGKSTMLDGEAIGRVFCWDHNSFEGLNFLIRRVLIMCRGCTVQESTQDSL